MGIRATVALLVLLVAGCGAQQAGGESSLRGKVFTSTSVTDQGKPRTLVEGTKIELQFTDDGRLLADAGCNHMGGQVSTDGAKLAVADLSITDMACPAPGAGEQDTWLSKLLTAQPSWRLDGANLVVTGSDAEIVLTPEQPATLEGTWTVNGLLRPDVVASVPDGAKVTITFKNGTVAVDSGCNRNGNEVPYVLEGATIKAQLGPQTLKSCGAVDEVEAAVNATFETGAVTYEIERSTLTLTNASDAGVQLTK
ncbi:META domain-containing protein [Lentzea sp. NPDC058450]|uniref:META domain-containing protein n=1 Tax=Lentzea sp. NPDC058450 TaxID=3346505 RepID=UPI003667F9EF